MPVSDPRYYDSVKAFESASTPPEKTTPHHIWQVLHHELEEQEGVTEGTVESVETIINRRLQTVFSPEFLCPEMSYDGGVVHAMYRKCCAWS